MRKYLLILLLLLHAPTLHADSVVCLHGFFRSYRCMIPVGNTLRKTGFHVYLWDYPSRRKTIEEHAASLVEVLKGIAKEHPSQPIHFVSHSLGGLVVRAAMNRGDCPQEAKTGKAILLAPPNQGAALARCFNTWPPVRWIFGKKAGAQLLTYQADHMDKIGKFPESMQVMVIAGKKSGRFYPRWAEGANDGKVSVEETRLSSPHIHHTLHVGHSWIMRSRQSIALTRKFLLSKETSSTSSQEDNSTKKEEHTSSYSHPPQNKHSF